MEKLLITTPQNVQIEYRLASIGTRFIATAIDYAIIISYAYLVYKSFDVFFSNIKDVWTYYGVLTFFSLPALFYHFLMETFLGGQTLGKKAVKTKVVKIDGTRASVYEYFIRWVLSIVDIWMLSGLVGLLSIILSKKSQRLGDFAADTTVVSLKPQLAIKETIYEEVEKNYQVTFPQVINLTDKDINIIKKSFQQALDKDEYWLIETLAQKVQTVLKVEELKLSHIEFLKTVIQDHYFLFKKQ